MFRHFISTEPHKRNKTTSPPPSPKKRPPPSPKKRPRLTNWKQLSLQWQGIDNNQSAIERHRERMQKLEEYLFDEDGGIFAGNENIIDAWANYNNTRSNAEYFMQLIHSLQQYLGQLQPYLTTLFYDAVLYNAKTYAKFVDQMEGDLKILFSNDRDVLICALEHSPERDNYDLDAILSSGYTLQYDIDIWYEHVLNKDASYLASLPDDDLIDDEVIELVILGLGNIDDDKKESIFVTLINYLEHTDDDKRTQEKKELVLQIIPYYEEFLRDAESWQNDEDIVLKAVECHGSDQFQYADDSFLTNKHFMLKAIHEDYHSCDWADNSLLSDNAFAAAAMDINANVFEYLQAQDRNKEDFIERAVRADWRNFQFAYEHKRGFLTNGDDRTQESVQESVQEEGRAMVMRLLNNVPGCGRLILYTPFRNEEDLMRSFILTAGLMAILSLGQNLRNNPVFLYEMLQHVDDVHYPIIQNSLFAGGFQFVAPQDMEEIELTELNASLTIEQFRVRYQIWLENKERMVAHMVANIMRFGYL